MPKDEPEPEDPMEFVGMSFPGTSVSDEEMARAVVEEFFLAGHGRDGLLDLFRDPFYQGTHRLCAERGESWVVVQVDAVLREWAPDW